MTNFLNGNEVRDFILKQGYSSTEAAAFALGNWTKGIAETSKTALTAQSGSRIGSGAYKATKDFSKGDVMCGTLCSVSIGCETACAIIVWIPVPCKFATIGILKGVSHASTKFRDLCANDLSNPFC